jgi:polygalacturonase
VHGVVDVTQLGAVDLGEANNAAAIARASQRCTQLGGCILLFPARPRLPSSGSEATVYRTSSFVIPSHTTHLFIPRGVVLRGTETDADNLDDSVWYIDCSPLCFGRCLLC